ncbi:MAG: DUF6320 domain-containing protein [Bacillus sp. (in: Bacteria)]|nr:DUF6320 domain-containing protein [Bacillus sp. (in: firmicutes)]MCM1426748.1 DUF6320 domain-containing protein [Eubacterium sp.]
MSYCVNCGVKLESSLKTCPLCNTPVINPNHPEPEIKAAPYPPSRGQVEVVKRKDLGLLLSVVLSATSVTCLLLNLLVFKSIPWSVLVIGICICLFFFAFPAVIYTKTPIYLSLLADGIAVGIYLYLITYLTSSNRWFRQLALPIVVTVTLLIELFTLLSRKFPFHILTASLYLFIEAPVLCVTLELLIRRFLQRPLGITWSAVVLTVCAIIDITLITIISKKRLRNEVRRRLYF